MNKICLGIIIVFLFIMGCTSEKKVIHGSLVPVDSLGWEDTDEYVITAPYSIKIYNDKIYASELECINVFDAETFRYEKTIGNKGRAPGEFMLVNDFCFLDDTLFACDYGNQRIQQFTPDGAYIGEFKHRNPYIAESDGKNTFFANYLHQPDNQLTGRNGDFNGMQISVNKFFEENNIKIEYVIYKILDGKPLVAVQTMEGLEFYISDDFKALTKFELPESFRSFSFDRITNMHVADDKIYMICINGRGFKGADSGNSAVLKKESQIKEYLVVTDHKFEVQALYRLPETIYASIQSLWVFGDSVLISSFFDGIIYKLKFEI